MANSLPRYFPLAAEFNDDPTRAPFPRQLIVYNAEDNKWLPCTDKAKLPTIDYVAISYRQTDYPDKQELERTVQSACEVLQINAYWLDFACTGRTVEEKNADLYRIADVFRGAKKTLIMIKGDDKSVRSDGWSSWGDRVWTLPEALLSLTLLCKVGSRRIEEVNLRRVANLSYRYNEEEMVLVDGYSGKDPLPIVEKVALLCRALWKRSSGPDMKNLAGNVTAKQNSQFTAYPGERVYALMGFMLYRIIPDRNESEEEAFDRLMKENKLDFIKFSDISISSIPPSTTQTQVSSPQRSPAQTSLMEPMRLPTKSAPILDNNNPTPPAQNSTQSAEESNSSNKSVPSEKKKESNKKKRNINPFSQIKNVFKQTDENAQQSDDQKVPEAPTQHFTSIDSPMLKDLPINTDEQKKLFSEILARFEAIVNEAQLVPSRARDLFGVDLLSRSQIKVILDRIDLLPLSNLSPLEQSYLKLKYNTLFRAFKDRGVEDESASGSEDEITDEVLDTIHSVYTLQNITSKSSVGDWVYSLHNVCLASMGLGRYTEGLQLCQWECSIWRVLAKNNPNEFNVSFVVCLTNLTACLTYLTRDEEALIAIEEAIQVQRALPSDLSFTLSLERRAALLARCGRGQEAVQQMQEVVKVNKTLAHGHGEVQYARSLTSYADSLIDNRQYDTAYSVVKEAVELQRKLVQSNSDSSEIQFQLSSSLLSLADTLIHKEEPGAEQALKTCQEACDILRQLSEDDPDMYEKHLAPALVTLYQCHTALRQKEGAAKSIEEAVRIKRAFTQEFPEKDLVYDLEKLCRAYYNNRQYELALETVRDAVHIRRRMLSGADDSTMDAAKKHLNKDLEYMSYCLGKLGREEEASLIEKEREELQNPK